jgi:hypothetical protein
MLLQSLPLAFRRALRLSGMLKEEWITGRDVFVEVLPSARCGRRHQG